MLQCLFYSQTCFPSSPLCSLSNTKTLEQKQLGEPLSGLLTEAAPQSRYLFCFLQQWLQEPEELWQGLQMCFSCLADEPVDDTQSYGFCCINCSKLHMLPSCPTSLLSP